MDSSWWNSLIIAEKSFSGTGYSLQKRNRGSWKRRCFSTRDLFQIKGVHDIFGSQKSFGVQGVKSGSYVEASLTWEDFGDLEDFLHQIPWPKLNETFHDVGKSLSESAVRSRWTGASVFFGCKMCRFLCLEICWWNCPLLFLVTCFSVFSVTGTTDCCLGGECLSLDVFSFI